MLAIQETAERFLKDGYYCPYPWESSDWYDFWERELDRIKNGYEADGIRITGEHYFYLNFTQIKRLAFKKGSNRGKKIVSFPDFWDGDYNYFWAREIARNGISKEEYEKLNLMVKIDEEFLDGGYNLIVGKSRRKGYSYKNASIATRNLILFPNSLTIMNAYEARFLFPRGIFGMALQNIHFLNNHTAFIIPSDKVNRNNHIRNSFITYINGVQVEKGMMSEIVALPAKENPDVNRGKDAIDIFIEEAGAFGKPGLLKDLYFASEDCVQSGMIKTGMITIFGTSGDMEAGSVDYADMFMRPEAFGLLPFNNIWDTNMEDSKCGFFHPIQWNMEGFYDEYGKSDIKGAVEAVLKEREKLVARGASSEEMAKRRQEKPLSPLEAFSTSGYNIFPEDELRKQLSIVKSKNLFNKKAVPIRLFYEDGNIRGEPILKPKHPPITSYKNLPDDLKGQFVVYEFPIDNAPQDSYIIGYDPVRHDKGTSLAAIVVFKTHVPGSATHSQIVAEYIGRLETAEDHDRLAMMIAEYYGAKIMHENEIPTTFNFFKKVKKLHLLMSKPRLVIEKNLKASKTARIYGTHVTKALKIAGESYIKEWLLEEYSRDENGKVILNLHNIFSPRLLEELIYYNPKKNYDYISALIQVMFAWQERIISNREEKVKKTKDIAKDLLDLYSNYGAK